MLNGIVSSSASVMIEESVIVTNACKTLPRSNCTFVVPLLWSSFVSIILFGLVNLFSTFIFIKSLI